MGEAWERVTKKPKSQMSDDELRTYFDSHLRGVGECPNPSCNCVAIIADRDVILLLFEKKIGLSSCPS